MVKKITMHLDLSKASGPDCIPVVLLKNCEPERSYILAELLRKGLLLKATALLISKVSEKLIIGLLIS